MVARFGIAKQTLLILILFFRFPFYEKAIHINRI